MDGKSARPEALEMEEKANDNYSFEINKASPTINYDEFYTQDFMGQKLQEFYDLSLLKQQHPEFQEDISKQLLGLSSAKAKIPKLSQEIRIENLHLLEKVEKSNDTVSKLKLSYDIVSELGKEKDTIVAVITIKKTNLEGKPFESIKLKFEK